MNVEAIEKHFTSFLDKHWKLDNTLPFLLTYIKLLLLFRSELPEIALSTVLERQKQLRGDTFNSEHFSALRNMSRVEMDRHLRNNVSATKEAMLNRLLFCALLDSEENDFFYLTEPLFEFARQMKVTPDQLKEILESEFVGFNVKL